MGFLEYITTNSDAIINAVSAVLAALAAIAALTPTDKDNSVVDRLNNVFKKLTGRQ